MRGAPRQSNPFRRGGRTVPAALVPLLLASCVSTNLGVGIDDEIERAIRGRGADVSVLVVDVGSGEVLYRRRPDMLMHPASTLKILPVAALIARAHAKRFVETRLVRSADGRTVSLVGGGDPLLTSEEVRRLAGAILLDGKGPVDRIVADAGRFAGLRFGRGWMWDDEPQSFMPHVSALTVDGGCVRVEVEEGRARVHPDCGHVELVLERGSAGAVKIDRNWREGGNRITVAGRVGPGAKVSRRLSVARPHLMAARVLATQLVRLAGGKRSVSVVSGRAETLGPGRRVVARRRRPVAEICTRTLKHSDNLGAESLLRLLGVWDRGKGSARAGLEVVGEYLRGLGIEPARHRIVDGSGLSHYNLVSARLLVAVLSDMARRADFEVFRDSLPVGGVDGTLAGRMKGTHAMQNVRAKTGTLSGSSNLTGYVIDARGRRLAFAILVGHYIGPAAGWRNLQDRICALLADAGL